jgi:hypothetical protein
LPPLVLASLDAALTLAGQPPEYWRGDYARVNELSPTFNQLLAIHPLAFVAGFIGWLLAFTCLILLFPRTLALATSIAVAIGHTWGATTWLLYRFDYGYQACNALFILTAIALAVGIRWTWGNAPWDGPQTVARLPNILRWSGICLLLALVAYLFLWPRKP